MPELMRMPEVAAGATEAILAAWNVELGSTFQAGDIVVTVETDKAVVDIEAEAGGVLLRTLVGAGATVEVGNPIALLGAVGEDVPDIDAALAAIGFTIAAAGSESSAGSAAASEGTTADQSSTTGPGYRTNPPAGAAVAPAPAAGSHARVFASPLARKLAHEAGLTLGDIAGSGPDGRVRRRDVDAHLAATQAGVAAISTGDTQPAARSDETPAFVDVPITRMRAAIAARLVESKQSAPNFYVKGLARVDRLMELRREINDGGSVRVSVNDLIVKAVATAHSYVPELNVIWTGEAVRHFSRVDVAIAVATPNGLLTPVVRGVDRLRVTEVAEMTADLAARAKDKKLQQSELEGGSVSVSNLGMFGIEEFSAILNPPQSSILAVGAARHEAVVAQGRIEAATVLRVTLTVDHRPVDGATAARWMQVFTDLLEQPSRILV
jgi:pyruvate dehydrogenase E2 component (dihydrolipoamide acetyltransferase)